MLYKYCQLIDLEKFMRLYINDTSPFSRLVLVTALEIGISDMDLAWIDPWASPEELLALNPFSTIPALDIGNGPGLYDSLLICEYLIANTDRAHSLTLTDYRHRATLQQFALGKNLMELAFRKVIMERFSATSNNNVLLERANAALVRALDSLDAIVEQSESQPVRPSLPDLCLAVALAYVQFRLNDLFAAQVSQKARAWLTVWCNRPSFLCTTPEKLKNRPPGLSVLSDH